MSFDEVKMRVGMERLLSHYELLDARTKRKGDELTLHCLFHDNDTTPSLKINTAKNIFNCFGCHVGGDTIGFVVLVKLPRRYRSHVLVNFLPVLSIIERSSSINVPCR